MEDYFKLFDLPFTFSVDQERLRRKFLQNSREFHPDLKTDKESHRLAEERSSANNEGFRVLKDFFETTAYILKFKGLLTEGEKENIAPEFLAEMMEINEGLMELEMDFNQAALERIRKQSTERREATEQSIRAMAAEYDKTQDERVIEEIKTEFLKRKYLLRIKDSIDKFATS